MLAWLLSSTVRSILSEFNINHCVSFYPTEPCRDIQWVSNFQIFVWFWIHINHIKTFSWKSWPLHFSPYRAIHCKPFTSLEPVNCQTEFTDFSGPFQLIMWKKMMHVLHTSKFTITFIWSFQGAMVVSTCVKLFPSAPCNWPLLIFTGVNQIQYST